MSKWHGGDSIVLTGGVELMTVAVDPSAGAGVAAEVGSFATRTDAAGLWQKTSAPDTGWAPAGFIGTPTRIPFAGATGLLEDSADLTWDGSALGLAAGKSIAGAGALSITTGAGDLTLAPAGAQILIPRSTKVVLNGDGVADNYIVGTADTTIDIVFGAIDAVRMQDWRFLHKVHLLGATSNNYDVGGVGNEWRSGYFNTSVTGTRGYMLDLAGDSVVGTSGEHIYSSADGKIDIHGGNTINIYTNNTLRATWALSTVTMTVTQKFVDNYNQQFGSSGDVRMLYATAQTPHAFMLGLGADSNGMIVCEKADTGYDFAHALQTNPTIWLQSAAQSATEWTSLSHGVIATGAGDLTLAPAGNISVANKILDFSTAGDQRDHISAIAAGTVNLYAGNVLSMSFNSAVVKLKSTVFQASSNNSRDLGAAAVNWRTGFFGTSVSGTRGYMLDLAGDSVVGTSGEHIYSSADNVLDYWAGLGHRFHAAYLEIEEVSAPGAGAADSCRLYTVNNGGKTELYAQFQTGGGVLVALEA